MKVAELISIFNQVPLDAEVKSLKDGDNLFDSEEIKTVLEEKQIISSEEEKKTTIFLITK